MKSLKSRLKKHEVTITQTADWNKYDERLMRSAERGDVEKISSTLAKKGVNPSKLDLEGRSAFHIVASKGHLECLNAILLHGVDLTAHDAAGRNALHLSAKYGHSLCLQKLLQFNCPTENVDLQGRTALHDAAMSDCCSSVQLLCDHGASVNAKDLDGRTPLALATQMCRPAICQLLIEKGADVNARDKQNKTPLMLGCEYGCREAVEVLLRAGADITLVDSLGHDCAYYSRIGDNLEILSLIRTAVESSPRGAEPIRSMVSLRSVSVVNILHSLIITYYNAQCTLTPFQHVMHIYIVMAARIGNNSEPDRVGLHTAVTLNAESVRRRLPALSKE